MNETEGTPQDGGDTYYIVDLSPVLDSLDLMTGHLETIENHVQRIDANTVTDFVVSALLIGVVLGVAISRLLRDLWR